MMTNLIFYSCSKTALIEISKKASALSSSAGKSAKEVQIYNKGYSYLFREEATE